MKVRRQVQVSYEGLYDIVIDFILHIKANEDFKREGTLIRTQRLCSRDKI